MQGRESPPHTPPVTESPHDEHPVTDSPRDALAAALATLSGALTSARAVAGTSDGGDGDARGGAGAADTAAEAGAGGDAGAGSRAQHNVAGVNAARLSAADGRDAHVEAAPSAVDAHRRFSLASSTGQRFVVLSPGRFVDGMPPRLGPDDAVPGDAP